MKKTINVCFKEAANLIYNNRNKFHSILRPLSTYNNTRFEIDSAISTLKNAEYEIIREQPPTIHKMAVYHSSNVILYSYVLYGVIPSAYCDEIIIRPSTHATEQTLQVHELFQSHLQLPIKMMPISQRKFNEHASDANAVIFTGRYENSVSVREHFPQSLFLFFGSGTNPLVIGKNADIQQALSASLTGRLITSGQDCLCHNVIFVHESVASSYLTQLVTAIKQLKFAENDNPYADYGPIFYDGVIEFAFSFWQEHKQLCIHHGRIDIKNKILDPLIFVSSLDGIVPFKEFFSPVFYIVTYSDDISLEDWLLQPDQLRKAMGLSLFGDINLSPFIHRYYTASYNKPYFENESGNEPFGGFGVEASYAYYNGNVYSRPLLISREIRKIYGQQTAYLVG